MLNGQVVQYLSHIMRKPAFFICKNKGQISCVVTTRTADKYLCFRYIDSTICLLSKSGNSCLQPSSVAVQPGLCQTRSETPKTCFLVKWLICSFMILASLCSCQGDLSRVMRKPTFWFPTRSDTNQAVQLQKMARCLKFRI